jgi:plastocyanin
MRARTLGVMAVVGVIAAVAIFASVAAARSSSAPKLYGTVGKNNAFVIKLLTASAKHVTTLKAGTYTFVIRDDSALHNYELDGPHGKSWTFTSVPFMGSKTFTIALKAGKYKAYCSAHESTMFQHFTVM